MRCFVNGDLIIIWKCKGYVLDICRDNRTSFIWGRDLPGDIIGSGTVGGGCLLEINGTKKRK